MNPEQPEATGSADLHPDRGRVVEQLALLAGTDPGRPALLTPDGVVSYRRLYDQVRQTAALLRRHQPRVLAIWLDNGADWVRLDLAAQWLGIPVVPLPLYFSGQQLVHALEAAGVDLLAAPDAEPAQRLELGFMPADRLGTGAVILRRACPAAKLPPRTAKITFTSGTTAQPKGVCLSQCLLDRLLESLDERLGGIELQRHSCLLPLAVLLENIAGCHLALFKGAGCAVFPLSQMGWRGSNSLDPRQLAAFLKQQNSESLILTPQLLKLVCALTARGQLDAGAFRFLAVGGGRVGSAVLRQSEALGLPVYQGYGLSECGSVVALNPPLANRHGSVGPPLSHLQVRCSAAGEIEVQGAAMLGYLGESGQPSDWLATGDLGYRDAEGYLYLKGRRKQVFINNYGRNFNPEWIEAELEALPEVGRALLIGDERPHNLALIEPAAGWDAAGFEQRLAALNETLPDYARVHCWTLLPEPLSLEAGTLTGTGRVRRGAVEKRQRALIEPFYQTANGEVGA